MGTAERFKKWIPGPAKQVSLRFLERGGLTLTSITPLDLRSLTDDPLEASYRAGTERVLVNIPMAHCRFMGPTAIPGNAVDHHPFVRTLAAHDRGECATYEESPLHEFYRTWQPRNVAEALGIDPRSANSRIAGEATIGLVLPWWDIDPARRAETMVDAVLEENRRHGAALDGTHGLIFFGPVSQAKGELEFKRLVELFNSVRTNGYVCGQASEDGDIRGRLLARGSAWKVKILRGEHRAAALAALGRDTLPIRFDSRLVVRREEVDSWPNVRSGLFSREQALSVFDRMFEGRQPALCDWRPGSSGDSQELPEIRCGVAGNAPASAKT